MFLNSQSYKALKRAKNGAIHPKIAKAIEEGRLVFFKNGAYKYTPSQNFTKPNVVRVPSTEIQVMKDSIKRLDKIIGWLDRPNEKLVRIHNNKAIFEKRNVR